MDYAPIVLFAFNRPDRLKATIETLLKNEEAKGSELFVFVDGARMDKEGEKEKVDEVQGIVKEIDGFKSVHYWFSDVNKGLGNSVIAGVSEVINKYGMAIILEDDLVLTPNFLAYMNQGLERYKDNERVFSICGYSNRVERPKNYQADTYFCSRSSSWGWGTWADRWNSVDWTLEPFEQYLRYKHQFNRWGGSDCFGMLKRWHDGRNKSWAIRFCFNQFLQGKVSLFPIQSLVINDGFDGEGTNCKKWSRFKFDIDNSGKKSFVYPENVSVDKRILKQVLAYNSMSKRIYSKIMYMIYG
ncbi:MAG: glycosyltransferase [Prevotellaceae bacterium]|nr:glycosyltransferase [Prevotellaceae bacterium]